MRLTLATIVTLLIFVGLLLLCNQAESQTRTLDILGHSDAGLECAHPQDFPGWRLECRFHYSEPCSFQLRMLPYDLRSLQVPDAVVVWLGTTDAERLHPVDDFMACARTYRDTIESTWPGIPVIWPNTPAFSRMTMLPPANYKDTRATVAAYNAALPSLQDGTVTVVDVHTFSTGPSGWAWPWYIPYIDFNAAGWQWVDSQIILPALEGR